MAYWSIALLLVSVSFLAFRHPPTGLKALPRWIRPGRRRDHRDGEGERSEHHSSGVAGNGRTRTLEVEIDTENVSEKDGAPKSTASNSAVVVPSLLLNEDPQLDEKHQLNPSNSNGTTSASLPSNKPRSSSPMAPPPKPPVTGAQKNSASLMAPPSRPTAAPPPSAANSLRVPSTGPLPNRGLPASSQQRVSGTLTPTGTVRTSNSRGKVLLSPGHSPMDWAALTRKSNLSGVSTFQRVTPSMLKTMTGRKGKPAWSSWQGKVYNITPYLPFHPGGEAEIMKAAGRDGAKLFMEVHPWVNWENMLGSCLVGVMVPENYSSSLEDMD